MNIDQIVKVIDSEIAKLQNIRSILADSLADNPVKRKYSARKTGPRPVTGAALKRKLKEDTPAKKETAPQARPKKTTAASRRKERAAALSLVRKQASKPSAPTIAKPVAKKASIKRVAPQTAVKKIVAAKKQPAKKTSAKRTEIPKKASVAEATATPSIVASPSPEPTT